MFYSVASPDWKPGQPLTPAGSLLFRSRGGGEPRLPPRRWSSRPWRSATTRRPGCVTPDAARLGPAVEILVGASPSATCSAGSPSSASSPRPLVRIQAVDKMHGSRPRRIDRATLGWHGWDSLTMALLA